jgi:hypothetical protein
MYIFSYLKSSYQSLLQHDSFCGALRCIQSLQIAELSVFFALHFNVTMFDRESLKCQPPASKQASHVLKIFLDMKQSSCI